MACTAQELVTDSRCLNHLGERQLLAAILCVLATQNNMACDPATLVADSKCLWTSMSERQLLASIALTLCEGGGGGAGIDWIIWEDTGPDPSGPPPDITKAVQVRFRDGYPPVTWDPVLGGYF